MALPSSGPLTMADIQTEFGGSNPISLSEYYAGGAYVPAGTSGTYGAVPSSGTISIRNFYGTSNVVITLTNQNVSAVNFGDDAQAQYKVASDGKVYEQINFGVETELEQWCTPTSAAGQYQVRATVASGTTPSGSSTGTWIALTGNVAWYFQVAPGNQSDCTLTVEIRLAATGVVKDSASIILSAQAF